VTGPGHAAVRTSVVVPVHDALRWLPAQLDALDRQEGAAPFEVVLADNRSTDGLAAAVPELAAGRPYPLRRVAADDRQGVAHARNVGCRAAVGELLLVCDADDVVCPRWVAEMQEGLRAAEMVTGTLRSDLLNPPLPRAWRPMYPPGVLPRKLDFLDYAPGCCVGVRASTFRAVGGWDESFVAGGDDVEFAWRVQLAGGRLVVRPGAEVQYRLRHDLRSTLRQTYAYARSDAQLLAVFRDRGARGTGPRPLVRELRWLRQNLVAAARRPGDRGLWLRRAAMLAGRVAGSVRHRAWAV
jgi:GT2 family glycosyltransferase